MTKMSQDLFQMIVRLQNVNFDLFASVLCIRFASHMASLDRNSPKTTLQKSLWNVVERAGPGEYTDAIIYALHQITPYFPGLSGLIDSVQSIKPEESVLKKMIELLSNIECDSISLSQIYEYRLGLEAREGSKWSGDFYTPSDLVHMMVKLLDVQKGSIYDPCCGSGAMLWQAFPGHQGLKFYGQTADEQSYRICHTNAFLHGQHINLGEKPADIFAEDLHSCRKFDYISANPPFNLSNWYNEFHPNDPRWRYGIPPQSNANFAWLQHIISHLSHHGRAAVILPNGALTTSVRAEQHIRQKILCAGLVEAIIALPPGLFYATTIPCSLWLIDKSRAPETNVLLIDAQHLQLKGAAEISTQNIAQIEELLLRHRAETIEGKTNWYAAVPLREIALMDYNLSPNLYTKADRIPIEEVQKNRSRLAKVMELLAARIENPDLSKLIWQWKSITPSSQWEKAFLLELYETFGGIAKPKECFGHGVAMVDLKTVIANLFVPDTLTASVAADESEAEKYQLKAGDILLNRTSETIEELACGCVAPKNRLAVYSAYVKRLRAIQEGSPNSFYMAGYLRSAIYRQEVKKVSTVYTTRTNINIKQLSRIAVYFPEPAMQRRLGDTLFAVSQFQGEKPNGELEELCRQFTDLLIEQYITYPVLCAQNREGGDT